MKIECTGVKIECIKYETLTEKIENEIYHRTKPTEVTLVTNEYSKPVDIRKYISGKETSYEKIKKTTEDFIKGITNKKIIVRYDGDKFYSIEDGRGLFPRSYEIKVSE